MEPVYDQNKSNETDYILIYCGGEFGFDNRQFAGCNISIQRTAARTLAFMQMFGIARRPDQFPTNTAPPGTTQAN